MNLMNIGTLAATRQTWRHKPVRELVAEILSEMPNANEKTIRIAFRDRVREDEDYFCAVADYAFDAAVRALSEQKKKQIPTAEQRALKAAESAERAAAHAKMVRGITEQILMLNLEMPNGKRMRYCTGAEMGKFGKGYERIAKKVGSTKMVGSVLDEKQVRELLGR